MRQERGRLRGYLNCVNASCMGPDSSGQVEAGEVLDIFVAIAVRCPLYNPPGKWMQLVLVLVRRFAYFGFLSLVT